MKLTTRQLTLCAVLTAMALALSYLENFFPLSLAIPIPGIKLGLANIVTLFALYALGTSQAFLILLVRCCLGSLFAGNVSALLFSLFGGVLAGAGLGLIYLRGATTGGSEVVARLLERRLRHIPIGRLILLVDAVVVAASALVYKQLESALYAMVLIFVSTSIMDAIVYGTRAGCCWSCPARRSCSAGKSWRRWGGG